MERKRAPRWAIRLTGWEDYREHGVWNSNPYEYKQRWGGKFKTETKKFEFYSATLKKALKGHAEKHKTDVDDILKTCNYTAKGELAFVPHYEPPFKHGDEKAYPFTFIDYKSRLNRKAEARTLRGTMSFIRLTSGMRAMKMSFRSTPLMPQSSALKTEIWSK